MSPASSPGSVPARALAPMPVPPGSGALLGALPAGPHMTWAFGVGVTPVPGGAERDTPLLLSDDGPGGGWRHVPLPSFDGAGRITAAAVVPGTRAPREGWLVGDRVASLGGALTEHWDGASWRIVTAPMPGGARGGGLLSVSARDADDVWATGWAEITDSGTPSPGRPGGTDVVSHVEALVEHWDGAAWHQVPLPDAAAFTPAGVIALGRSDVYAAGYSDTDHPALRHWNGRTWTPVPLPGTGRYGELSQLAAGPGGQLWAVGRTLLDDADPGHALVLRRAGRTWQRVPVPPDAGRLNGLALTPGGITAVGTTADGSHAYSARLTATASRWTPLPLPASPSLHLTAATPTTLVGATTPPTTTHPFPLILR